MFEVRKIFKNLSTDGVTGRVTCKDIIAHLPDAVGASLEEEELAFALEVMEVTHEDQDVPFSKFYEWWTTWSDLALAGSKRGHSSAYTQRFKLDKTVKFEEEYKFDVNHVERRHEGKQGSMDFRMQFYLKDVNADPSSPTSARTQISPWHDIPLHAGVAEDGQQLYHAVIEIPKWTRNKFEIATGEQYNPIKQDIKDGALRQLEFYQMFNYGALPQTWEDPAQCHDDTGYQGDNDPIDCVEIGTRQVPMGGVIVVRVIGVLAMIDDDETDWKLIVINEEDPLSKQIKDVHDLPVVMPGVSEGIVEWFTNYKTSLGTKPPNKFALGAKAREREYALSVVEETHKHWKELLSRQSSQHPGGGRSKVVVPGTHDN